MDQSEIDALRLQVMETLAYDPEEPKRPFKWRPEFAEKFVKTSDKPYSTIDPDGRMLVRFGEEFHPADKIAHLIMTGKYPAKNVVHADGNTINNHWQNIKDGA